MQLAFILEFFNYYPPSLWSFGISLLLSFFVTFIGHYIIWRKLTPTQFISLRYFDKNYLLEMTGMGKWIFIDQIGTLLFLNIDLLLVNQFLGPKVGGEYGSIILIPQMIRVFVSNIISPISPIQMEKYAKKDYDAVTNISVGTVKILSILLAVVTGILCGFSKEICNIWLGSEYDHLWKLFILLLLPILLTLPFQPLFQLQVAFKRVKATIISNIIFRNYQHRISLPICVLFTHGS